MSEERKLIQQLRDALNEYQPCNHANTEIVSAGWHNCKQCGELIRLIDAVSQQKGLPK